MLNRTGKYFSKRALLLSRQQHPSSGQLTRLNTTDARGFNFLAGDAKASTKEGLTFSTGIIGHLSESSVICRQGGSVLHAVVNSARTSDATDAFLPLTVDYRARQYAFGVIPTTSSRRERHGGDDEILVARCIDRAVRPLFPKGYVNEVQLLVTAHAADGVHDPTIAAVNAASFALLKSKQPWYGPIGCVRVGMIDGLLKVDPTLAEMETSTLDLVYAGTAGRALMVEAIGQQIPDVTIKVAMAMADSAVIEIINTQKALLQEIEYTAQQSKEAAALLSGEVESEAVSAPHSGKKAYFTVPAAMAEAVKQLGYERAVHVYSNGIAEKVARGRSEGKLRAELLETVSKHETWSTEHPIICSMAVDAMMHQAFRDVLLCKHVPAEDTAAHAAIRRSDGRGVDEVRRVSSAVEVLPSVHGSAYFARGDTHVLSTVTLGSLHDAKEILPIDGKGVEKKQPFMLHYDFPPYSTGEMGNSTATNRRMVGHGNLAEKGIRPVMPSEDEFPYTVRVYCECTGSNGSSSMASVCAGSLALFDAGVPLKAPVAAVSVGLVTDESVALDLDGSHHSADGAVLHGKEFVLLKDILGSEDHHGDMDYKIAGTDRGITAIQLDTKLAGGVPLRILDRALHTAHEGRLHILQHMQTTLAASRSRVRHQAPKAELVSYDEDRKGLLIGPRGDMKQYMEELYDVTLDVDSTPGKAYIYGKDAANVAACSKLVQDIAVLVKEGDTVSATVSSVLDYGVIVTINRAQQALLHVSELSHDSALLKRPTAELVKIGQRFNVKIETVDKATGVVKVSRKALLDKATSVPDTIRSLDTVEEGDADSIPTFPTSTSGLGVNKAAITFPTSPPRQYSKEFFTNNVVSDQDVAEAVRRQQGVSVAASAAHSTAYKNRPHTSSKPNSSAPGSDKPYTKKSFSKVTEAADSTSSSQ